MIYHKFLRLSILTLIAALFTNCKKHESVYKSESPQTVLLESSFKVVLDMVVPKDDTFQLFYIIKGTTDFSEEMSIRLNVKGSDSSQKILFELPEDINIINLRIDVGENVLQNQIQINNFYVDYYDRKFEVKPSEFLNYFRPTTEILSVDANGNIQLKPSKEFYDPGFYQLDNFVTVELEKIQNDDNNEL